MYTVRQDNLSGERIRGSPRPRFDSSASLVGESLRGPRSRRHFHVWPRLDSRRRVSPSPSSPIVIQPSGHIHVCIVISTAWSCPASRVRPGSNRSVRTAFIFLKWAPIPMQRAGLAALSPHDTETQCRAMASTSAGASHRACRAARALSGAVEFRVQLPDGSDTSLNAFTSVPVHRCRIH